MICKSKKLRISPKYILARFRESLPILGAFVDVCCVVLFGLGEDVADLRGRLEPKRLVAGLGDEADANDAP